MSADVLAVHLPSILSTNLAESLINLRDTVPARQIWLAVSLECSAHYPHMNDPDFMALFDLEASYRQTADIWTPYIPPDFSPEFRRNRLLPRNRGICAFISSNWDKSGRCDYMRDLADRISIDSFGHFMRNRRVWKDRGIPTKFALLKRYKFNLAFENSIADDYVTEKFYEPLLAGCVPVYLGAPNIEDFAPGDDCFIRVDDFKDAEALAHHLQTVDPRKYQQWRQRPLRPGFREKLAQVSLSSEDRISKRLKQLLAERS